MDTVRSMYDTWVQYPQPRKTRILRNVALVCYALFLLVLVVYAFGGTHTRTRTRRDVVVFAPATAPTLQVLRYLAQRRDVRVVMAVVSTHPWHIPTSATPDVLVDVRAFVADLQREGNDEVARMTLARGEAVPSSSSSSSRSGSHSGSGGGGGAAPWQSLPYFAPLLAELLNASQPHNATTTLVPSDDGVSFLVVGPCTDAASFLQHYTALRPRVREVVIAGGAFLHPADARALYPRSSSTRAEVNFRADARAADYLVAREHARPVTLLPYDATVVWPASLYAQLVTSRARGNGDGASSTQTALARALRVYDTAMSAWNSTRNKKDKEDDDDDDDHDKGNVTVQPRVALPMLAACYWADVATVQNGAQVTDIAVRVRHRSSNNKDDDEDEGVSYRPTNDTQLAHTRVVVSVVASTLWRHVSRMDALPVSSLSS